MNHSKALRQCHSHRHYNTRNDYIFHICVENVKHIINKKTNPICRHATMQATHVLMTSNG